MKGMVLEKERFAILMEAVRLQPDLAGFVPVRLTPGLRGEPLARPSPLNTSGDFAGLTATDGFIELPAGPGELAAGATVRFWPWV
jgi:molybdopterin molybdotransferase